MRRILALLAVGSLLAACSGSPSASAAAGGSVTATLNEWEISLSPSTLTAGEITFKITNNGDKEHEFVVRKTDLKADALPLNPDGSGEVSEDAPELTEVGDPSELAEIKPGSTDGTLTVTLQPGHYVIFCNLHVEDLVHYQKGMHADFTVN